MHKLFLWAGISLVALGATMFGAFIAPYIVSGEFRAIVPQQGGVSSIAAVLVAALGLSGGSFLVGIAWGPHDSRHPRMQHY